MSRTLRIKNLGPSKIAVKSRDNNLIYYWLSPGYTIRFTDAHRILRQDYLMLTNRSKNSVSSVSISISDGSDVKTYQTQLIDWRTHFIELKKTNQILNFMDKLAAPMHDEAYLEDNDTKKLVLGEMYSVTDHIIAETLDIASMEAQ